MSSRGGEMSGFVFSIVFILIFSGLLSTLPTGLQGTGSAPLDLVPVDPSILTEFTAGENYTKSAFTEGPTDLFGYEYSLGGKSWISVVDTSSSPYSLVLSAKVLFFFLWLGQLDSCYFTSATQNRGNILSFDEIDSDADDGTARYTLQHVISGTNAGGFIAYWNTTTYANSTHAWDNDALYLLHGIGLENTATNDIGALLVNLLFLQLPQVPALVNLFLAVPVWACIVYVLWFIIKEMIPFL